MRSLYALLAAVACVCASRALASPLSLDLGLPPLACPLLFGQTSPPPPVVLPPGPPEHGPAAAAQGAATLKLKDGRTLQGKILYQVQDGLLFRDEAGQRTFVVPFGDIVDLQQGASEGRLVLPAPAAIVPDRRLFLEGQIRDVKARYDALSYWSPIEELVGGALGIAGGVIFLALPIFGGDSTLEWVFAALLAVPGAISLVAGTVELASVVRRQNELQEQLAHLQAQLGTLKSEALPAPPPGLAFAF